MCCTTLYRSTYVVENNLLWFFNDLVGMQRYKSWGLALGDSYSYLVCEYEAISYFQFHFVKSVFIECNHI